MTGTKDFDPSSHGNLDSPATPPKKVVVDDSAEAFDAAMTKTWVRHRLGQNRGEDRPYHGVTGGFDTLLDARIATRRPLAALDKEY